MPPPPNYRYNIRPLGMWHKGGSLCLDYMGILYRDNFLSLWLKVIQERIYIILDIVYTSLFCRTFVVSNGIQTIDC